MHPLRLKGIEPRALHWQPMDHDPYSLPAQLELAVMSTEPLPNGLAVMPRGVIPEQYQGRGALRTEPHATPSQTGRGDSADRAPRHKPQPPLLDTRPAADQQAITGQSFRIRILRNDRGLLKPAVALRRDPAGLVRLGQPTPPHFIGKPQHPRGVS